jgi:hypothetical protein
MPASSSSRSSSIFSIDDSISSLSSFDVLTPTTPLFDEKMPIEQETGSQILQWKPLLFSTAFTQNVSTWLHFTAFPPQDLKKPLFHNLGIAEARSLLLYQGRLSPFASQSSQISPTDHVVIPKRLPRDLAHQLKSPQWQYFSVTQNRMPVGVGNLNTAFDHDIAVRPLVDGIERYIFGPMGLCVHAVCRIEDSGERFEEDVPRERLYLNEDVEVVCNLALRPWTQQFVAHQIKCSHERIRLDWDAGVQYRWASMKSQSEKSLLD